jgi:hypothetical protein
MATGITPFGESFGDPRRYMGQSPLAEVGKAIKTGLIGYGIQESGLEKWLNEKGMNRNKQGGYEYKAPAGAVAPTGAATGAVVPPQMQAAPMMPVSPAAPAGAPAPVSEEMPSDIGEQILNGTWTGVPSVPAGPISVMNPTDFNPLAPDESNQVAMSPDAYKNVPGYGKLKKVGEKLMGMG